MDEASFEIQNGTPFYRLEKDGASLFKSIQEIEEMVEIGYLNAIFTLARSIGLIGHIFDQKRLKSGLYRHPWDDIVYLVDKADHSRG
jgi:citrate synthase